MGLGIRVRHRARATARASATARDLHDAPLLREVLRGHGLDLVRGDTGEM